MFGVVSRETFRDVSIDINDFFRLRREWSTFSPDGISGLNDDPFGELIYGSIELRFAPNLADSMATLASVNGASLILEAWSVEVLY